MIGIVGMSGCKVEDFQTEFTLTKRISMATWNVESQCSEQRARAKFSGSKGFSSKWKSIFFLVSLRRIDVPVVGQGENSIREKYQ